MMARRRRSPAQPWQFWRRAFWTRPILLVVYAVLIGLAGVLVLLSVPDDVSDAYAMARADDCPQAAVRPDPEIGAPQHCLERIPVTLSGPHYRRGPGSKWWLHVEPHRSAYAIADLSTSGSRRLSDGDRADALLWQGEPVLIEKAPGDRVETEDWSHGRWLITLLLGLFVLSGCPMLLQSAWFKRSTASGWWSVDGDATGLLPVLTPLMSIACLLAVPAMLGLLPLMFGGGAEWAIGLAVAGLALTIFAIVKRGISGHSD
jgi:hypothetical protein